MQETSANNRQKHGIVSSEAILVDCYGRSFFPEFNATVANKSYRFVFDESLKSGISKFHLGMFLNEVAAGPLTCFRYPRQRRICLLSESPIFPYYHDLLCLERRFDTILTFVRDLVELNGPYKRMLYGDSWVARHLQSVPVKTRDISFVGSIAHDDRPGYNFRKQIAEAMIKHPNVDCYGRGIQEIESKLDGLAPYRFSIAMENTQKDWYFSEKLIDCLATDTVPVYWGCPSIGDIFDQRGIVTFNSLQELDSLLPTLTSDRYATMLPFLRKNWQNALDRGHYSMEAYFQRIAEELTNCVRVQPTSLAAWRKNKCIAILRFAWETCWRTPLRKPYFANRLTSSKDIKS